MLPQGLRGDQCGPGGMHSLRATAFTSVARPVDQTALYGILSTGIPIIFGLGQDLNEEFTHNTTDTTEGQLQLIREQMATQAQKLAAHTQQLAALPALVQQELLALLVNRTFMLSCEVHAYRA